MRVPEGLVIFLKGMLMGMADIVPGVSGGTMALITGIYERFIHALSSVNFRFITRRLKGDREGALESWRSIELAFLVPLVFGILIAMVIFARVIEYIIDNQPGPTYAFFFGLILASAGFVYRYVERIDGGHLLAGVAGFVIVVLIVGMENLFNNHALPVILVSGAIAVCAMILPGISGALILVILGQYEYIVDALNRLSWKDLFVFAAGAIVGILAFSRLLDFLIRNYGSITMAFLFGCMVGALRRPLEEILTATDTTSTASVALVIIAAIVGFGMVFVLERRSDRIKARLGMEIK